MDHLYKRLEAYQREDRYPFHMPGHKQNAQTVDADFPFSRDITEIDGFDNLHHAEGILRDAQRFVSELYGTKESFYSINGSTAALLSAVFAAVKKGGRLLVARNCHKAVYHAMYLRDIYPVYLYPVPEPEFRINGGISPLDVENALKRFSDIQAVLITSPTYDGVVSDVERIAGIAHAHGIPLIVDAAHGAHFHFSGYFPTPAEDLGADVVIQSCHKTLPSMTQTAILHRCSDRVSGKLLARYMGMFQSSSPSYILMASIDACMEKLSRDGEAMFQAYTKLLEETREQLAKNSHIRLISEEIIGRAEIFDLDRSKLVFSTEYARRNGSELEQILLHKYHLQMEMAAENYVTALTSVGDTEEGFSRLCQAIQELDAEEAHFLEEKSFLAQVCKSEEEGNSEESHFPKEIKSAPYPKLPQVKTISEAMDAETEVLPLQNSIGRICAEFAYLYPPGIPLVVPGEQITAELVEKMEQSKRESLDLQGLMDYTGEMIRVLKG